MRTFFLYAVTALAEIFGCYLTYLVLKQGRPLWLWAVDGIRPTAWDIASVGVALIGMAIIVCQPR